MITMCTYATHTSGDALFALPGGECIPAALIAHSFPRHIFTTTFFSCPNLSGLFLLWVAKQWYNGVSVCVCDPIALLCTVDTWVLADLMKRTRRTETPAGSCRGRATAKARWRRAHPNPNSGRLVLSVTSNTQEGCDPIPTTLPPLLSQQAGPAASRGKDGEEEHKELCFYTGLSIMSYLLWHNHWHHEVVLIRVFFFLI